MAEVMDQEAAAVVVVMADDKYLLNRGNFVHKEHHTLKNKKNSGSFKNAGEKSTVSASKDIV